MLILSNDDVEALISIEDCIQGIETAYRELGDGRAVTRERTDTIGPGSLPGAVYALKTADGLLPSARVAVVRINSDVIHWPVEGGFTRREKLPAVPGQRWVGLLLLFSTETGEPLAILPDGVLQRLRVGATSGLAVKYLARSDADSMGLLGSGWQAGAHLMAVLSFRPMKLIRVYSPNAQRRSSFASEMQERLGTEIVAVDSPEAAVRGAAIVLAATNALEPVFRRHWIEPGMHLGCIRDTELDVEAVACCDRVYVNNPQREAHHCLVPSLGQRVPEVGNSLAWWDRWKSMGKADPPLLADLLVGRVPGRGTDGEVTCFLNNLGMGLQFAALGGIIYQRAREQRRGRDLPLDWFVQTVKP